MADSLKLTDIEITTEELGRGAYGVVKVLYFKGLRCAGKIIYKDLCSKDSRIISRYEEECILLSQLHHPNIVQFLGTCSDDESDDLPIMVMELLSTNLSGCLNKYEILPEEISYSILQDVALGLHYLHTRSPLVIHRDLSANNVLLSADMTAKISDLGQSKILNLSVQKLVETMTKAPGTQAYMPPEALVNDPKYDTSIDVFSYGIMIIHVLVGQWPTVQTEAVIAGNSGTLVPVSEFDRRLGYLEIIGMSHPLMDLIRECLNNIPEQRAKSGELVEQIKEVAKTKPKTYLTRLEMVKKIEKLEQGSKGHTVKIQEESGKNFEDMKQEHEEELKRIRAETQEMLEQRRIKQRRTDLLQSAEITQLKHKLASANTAKNAQEKENETLSSEIDIFKQGAKKQREQLDKTMETFEKDMAKAQTKQETELTKMREEVKDLNRENQSLKSRNERLKLTITLKTQENTKANGALRSKQVEVEQNKVIIGQNEATIQALNSQLTNVREYLTIQGQPMQANIEWVEQKSCSEPLSQSDATLLEGKVYCKAYSSSAKQSVLCYDPSSDVWYNGLPPLPGNVTKFGLGQVNGKIVAVGGITKPDNTVTSEIIVWDYSKLGTQNRKWKRTVTAMPTARHSPTVVSHKSLLIVAGGMTQDKEVTDVVEIHNSDTNQWSLAPPTPFPMSEMSPVIVEDHLYLVGGFLGKTRTSNKAICASIDSLMVHSLPLETSRGRAVSHRQNLQGSDSPGMSKRRGSTFLESPHDPPSSDQAWKMLCDTPQYGVTGVNVTGSLLVLGGEAHAGGGTVSKEMYAYSSKLNMWTKIGCLPGSRLLPTVVKISPFEFVVIGGLNSSNMRTDQTYKGSIMGFI